MPDGMGAGGYQKINKLLKADAFADYLAMQQASLPELPNVERLSERVTRILGFNPGKLTLQGTNTYLIGTGDSRILLDTGQGIPLWADAVAEYLRNENVSISQVLLTHWHGDHTGGVPDLIKMYPHLTDEIYKNAPDHGQINISDGQKFVAQGATLKALHSPGHAHDHMCFILQEENAMFTGDNILGHTSSGYEDLGLYMESLELMQNQACGLGYPAHGAVVTDLRAKLTQELAQKRRRERQVLMKLQKLHEEEAGNGDGSGERSVQALVTAIHGDTVSEEMRRQILEPLTEGILEKLAGEGKVEFRVAGGEERWFLAGNGQHI